MPFIDDLCALGLTQKESTIYLALVETGSTTAYVLGKKVSAPRATIYFILDALADKGLVVRQKKGGTTLYSANPPSYLTSMVEREQTRINEKLLKARELSKSLVALFRVKIPALPRVEI